MGHGVTSALVVVRNFSSVEEVSQIQDKSSCLRFSRLFFSFYHVYKIIQTIIEVSGLPVNSLRNDKKKQILHLLLCVKLDFVVLQRELESY